MQLFRTRQSAAYQFVSVSSSLDIALVIYLYLDVFSHFKQSLQFCGLQIWNSIIKTGPKGRRVNAIQLAFFIHCQKCL